MTETKIDVNYKIRKSKLIIKVKIVNPTQTNTLRQMFRIFRTNSQAYNGRIQAVEDFSTWYLVQNY